MVVDLEAFCKHFTAELHHRVGELCNLGVDPGDRDRIDKLAIFFALEDCRDRFARNADGALPTSRFSMREPKDVTVSALHGALERTRGGGGRTLLSKAKKNLMEYLVDFSFSNYSIPQAIGKSKSTAAKQFKLLLAAESELGSQFDVLRDFLKLVVVRSPVKVMVYSARTRTNYLTALIDGFERILDTHAKPYLKDESRWLFVGIPRYAQWIEQWDKPESLPRQVYVVGPNLDKPKLQAKDWWRWRA